MIYNINSLAHTYILFKDEHGNMFAAKCYNPVISQTIGEHHWLSGEPIANCVTTKLECELSELQQIEHLLPFNVTEEEILKVFAEE